MKHKCNPKHLTAITRNVVCAINIIAIVLLALSAQTKETNGESSSLEIPAIETKTVDGFCIGLAGFPPYANDYSTNNTSLDDRLVFFPWTTNNPAWIAIPVEPEYAYQVELFDTNGAAMPKTELGRKVGSKFFNFNAGSYRKGVSIKRLHAERQGEVTDSPILFYPYHTSDFFMIGKPGKYTLQIRFQILTFPKIGIGRGQYTNDLIRFPPLNYPILQVTSQTNLH